LGVHIWPLFPQVPEVASCKAARETNLSHVNPNCKVLVKSTGEALKDIVDVPV
jgi:hypothetical protein